MLTTEQAGVRLGISQRRVRQLITNGRIKAERVGHAYIVSEEALADYKPRPTGHPRKVVNSHVA